MVGETDVFEVQETASEPHAHPLDGGPDPLGSLLDEVDHDLLFGGIVEIGPGVLLDDLGEIHLLEQDLRGDLPHDPVHGRYLAAEFRHPAPVLGGKEGPAADHHLFAGDPHDPDGRTGLAALDRIIRLVAHVVEGNPPFIVGAALDEERVPRPQIPDAPFDGAPGGFEGFSVVGVIPRSGNVKGPRGLEHGPGAVGLDVDVGGGQPGQNRQQKNTKKHIFHREIPMFGNRYQYAAVELGFHVTPSHLVVSMEGMLCQL